MTKTEKLKKEILDLNMQLLDKQRELDEHMSRNTYLVCNHKWFKSCGKKFAVKSVDYIQNQWYEEPYGCTDGDCWLNGEAYIICPHCGLKHDIEDLNKELLNKRNLFKDFFYERNGKLSKEHVW